MRVKAIILAGGKGTRLGSLTIKRAKPAVPFAGKYRIIDFTLSNCVNSNIFDVLILTQYRPHSLNDHIGKGRPWDLDRTFTGGVQLLQPYKGSFDTDWYAGTADAVTQNLNFVRSGQPEYVLILSGDHIYQMDYDLLIQYHREKRAECTVCTIRVPLDEASRFGIIDVDEDYRVKEFIEKPADPPGNLASMGVYVFNYNTLERLLVEDQRKDGTESDFGKTILPKLIEETNDVYAYPYGGYWIDVGTIEAYWEAHMDLLQTPPSLNLNDRTWVIHTRSEERPPVRIESSAQITNSLITDGAVIGEGAVIENSVLSPGVYVGPHAVVRDSVILNDAYIEAGAHVERAIIDKIVVIGHKATVGSSQTMGDLNITAIGKNSKIPAGYTIGAGCLLGTDVGDEDFKPYAADRIVPSHTKLGYKSRS
ncbi:glucose-1-phosphate adenylyltransferase [Phototrophicus methaneseepsis]|uniref:Glucose-1-phosphate adenylyltransferase n=1 Tax=Phototrophicus methaneseepsis TaxID=2710758 RepID=A0A7S8E7H3_9CHLR|nr:glucose-1-phosphate adenylyltransferase [Phototrophicus methaneseepsis]QPC81776.1 glucose-1-phosphate adenylyltransferase [Phototrophicus methaneseepsis]